MDLIETLAEVIDARSFSSLWYWIAMAVLWSSATHWILGIPWDVVHRARRDPDDAGDLQDLARVNVNRVLRVARVAGALAAGSIAALLTLLAVTGFAYGSEFAQSVFLMAAPLTAAGMLALHSAQGIARDGAAGADLIAHLVRLRRRIQAVAIGAIFVAATYGMFRNLAVGPFG